MMSRTTYIFDKRIQNYRKNKNKPNICARCQRPLQIGEVVTTTSKGPIAKIYHLTCFNNMLITINPEETEQ